MAIAKSMGRLCLGNPTIFTFTSRVCPKYRLVHVHECTYVRTCIVFNIIMQKMDFDLVLCVPNRVIIVTHIFT